MIEKGYTPKNVSDGCAKAIVAIAGIGAKVAALIWIILKLCF